MKVKFDHSEHVTDSINTFWFRPEHKVDYTAGQFIELYLEHPNHDDRGIKRWFTLSSSPSEELISITTRLSSETVSTFKQALWKLNPGDVVKMVEPMGDFVLPIDPSVPLLFTIGGIGITPVRSMVKWLKDNNQRREITLLYAAGKESELAFIDLFKQYGLRLETLVGASHEKTTAEFVEHHVRFHEQKPHGLMYISGPEMLVESIVEHLKQHNITQEQLITDYFPNYQKI